MGVQWEYFTLNGAVSKAIYRKSQNYLASWAIASIEQSLIYNHIIFITTFRTIDSKMSVYSNSLGITSSVFYWTLKCHISTRIQQFIRYVPTYLKRKHLYGISANLRGIPAWNSSIFKIQSDSQSTLQSFAYSLYAWGRTFHVSFIQLRLIENLIFINFIVI